MVAGRNPWRKDFAGRTTGYCPKCSKVQIIVDDTKPRSKDLQGWSGHMRCLSCGTYFLNAWIQFAARIRWLSKKGPIYLDCTFRVGGSRFMNILFRDNPAIRTRWFKDAVAYGVRTRA
ncbi:MAG: hypothetical protein Q8P59_04325, partial [Dehalococcoidia bacterium]|nr:hypothetical protein [Dehalococcoidia bacterium]